MVSADETPVRGTGLSNGKAEPPAKEPAKRSRKPSKKAEKPERAVEVRAEPREEIVTPVAAPGSSATETLPIEPIETASIATPECSPAEAAPADPIPAAPLAPPSAPAPVNLQTIGNAVGNYTLRSFEQTSSFFEQLAGARSLNRVFELQTEYARQAFETFVAESEKIRDLHREMTRQRWSSIEGLMTGTKTTRAK